jgi:hypothetical protein
MKLDFDSIFKLGVGLEIIKGGSGTRKTNTLRVSVGDSGVTDFIFKPNGKLLKAVSHEQPTPEPEADESTGGQVPTE